MKKLLTLLLSALLVTSLFAGCGKGESTDATDKKDNTKTAQARTLDEIKESGKLIIGVFSDKNPFGYVDDNGDLKGYDVNFGKRLAKDLLGSEDAAEFVYVDAASRVEYLQTAKVDVMLANFTVTDERAEKVDFTLPYMKVALGVVSPEDALITSADDLEGKKLIVVKGTTAESYFSENYPELELVKFDEYQEAYDALLDGRGDAFSTDNTEVLAWALQIQSHRQYRKVIQNYLTISMMRLNHLLMNSSSMQITKIHLNQYMATALIQITLLLKVELLIKRY